jgi:hypothetical protein
MPRMRRIMPLKRSNDEGEGRMEREFVIAACTPAYLPACLSINIYKLSPNPVNILSFVLFLVCLCQHDPTTTPTQIVARTGTNR